jgi:uncharacterized protein with PIN domain
VHAQQPPGVAWFRFYAELNDFLRPHLRGAQLPVRWSSPTTVKHGVESLGVPHTEVDLLLVNGESSPFDRLLAPGDRVSVYPVFEAFDISTLTRVRPHPLRCLRFLLDCHLSRLASYLRMAGFDALCDPACDDAALARLAAVESRVLLTRDRGLLQRRMVTRGYYVREIFPRRQFEEVIRRFDLHTSLRPFTRCMRCNAELVEATRADAAAQAPAAVMARYTEFQRCPSCARIYWKGSHYHRMSVWMALP